MGEGGGQADSKKVLVSLSFVLFFFDRLKLCFRTPLSASAMRVSCSVGAGQESAMDSTYVPT